MKNSTITIRSKDSSTTLALLSVILGDANLELVSLDTNEPNTKVTAKVKPMRSTNMLPLTTWARRNKMKYHAAHHLFQKFGEHTMNPVPGVKRFFINQGTGNYRGVQTIVSGRKVRTDGHIWVELA